MDANPLRQLNARQVNLLLAVALGGALLTGLTSWAVGTGWARWWTVMHAVFGLSVIVLTPAKVRRSVRPGLRRARWTRWVSASFGVVVVATVVSGVVHATGLWTGVGYWAPLWSHFLLAFVTVPLLIWHMWSRPARPHRVDADRRLLIGGGAAVITSAAIVGATEGIVRLIGADAADRAASGSYEVGSFDPDRMPTVSWIDDRAPRGDPGDWPLRVAEEPVAIDELRAMSQPLVATLDCTGGWWSEQRWDVVPVSALLRSDARSFEVVGATGYRRIFPMRDADAVHLAVGYDGRPLRRGHGAPVRIVAPGRRGPWWVKWVVSVEPTDRPWWFQSPFPTT
jgi:hypothetical protein